MSASTRDIALDALFHPFSEGLLAWPGGEVLFLRAREGAALHAARVGKLVATQPFKPEADRLQRIGVELVDEDSLPAAAFALVLVLPPRQREEARALLAKACMAVAPGGTVVVAASNDEGGRTREAELKQLAGSAATLSKYHCRVAWARSDLGCDAALIAQWRGADAARTVITPNLPGGAFRSRPGVFAWDRVDPASRMLAELLPASLGGRVADFGAGWGYLSMQLLARCPGLASLDLYEADARALALAARNLADASVPVRVHWHDVTTGVPERFDVIVCNPPFHALGRGDRPDIGRAFIGAAADALKPRGRLWLVANRHLPYEEALGTGFASIATQKQEGGFKVVEACKA